MGRLVLPFKKTRMRGNAHRDGRPFGGSKLRFCLSPFQVKFASAGVCSAVLVPIESDFLLVINSNRFVALRR